MQKNYEKVERWIPLAGVGVAIAIILNTANALHTIINNGNVNSRQHQASE